MKQLFLKWLPQLSQRPEGDCLTCAQRVMIMYAGSDKHDSGMPSSHAQFMFFFSTYGAMFLRKRVTLEWHFTKALLCILLLAFAVAVAASRCDARNSICRPPPLL